MITPDVIRNFVDENFPGHGQTAEEWQFNSPFCDDKKKRLYINKNDGRWFDQKQQVGGSFITFVSQYLDIPIADAYKVLDTDYKDFSRIKSAVDIRDILASGFEEKVVEKEKKTLDPLDINPIMFDDVDELDQDGEEALYYLNTRRISSHGLGYFPKSDSTYGGRIYVPFYENGKLVFFLARSYTGSVLRYKNPPLDTDVVFNFDNIDDTVVIFEGSFDAMSLDNYVGTAILSNKMKEGQASKLMSIKTLKNVIFVPDHDEEVETRKTILKNLIYNYELMNKHKQLGRSVNFYIYDLEDGYKDFGEYKQKTGNGKIDLSECRPFDKTSLMFQLNMLGEKV